MNRFTIYEMELALAAQLCLAESPVATISIGQWATIRATSPHRAKRGKNSGGLHRRASFSSSGFDGWPRPVAA